MNVLVLGSEGQIGAPFCTALEKMGTQVVRWDKTISRRMNLATYDSDDLDALYQAILSADKVVFLAFEVGGSKFLLDKDKTISYISENVMLMNNVFNMLKATDKPFLFASSQMSNMHHTNYGFLKDLGERYCATMDNAWICRFWNVYGDEDPNNPKSHVITDFIHMAKTTGAITMRTDGEERRQFLHVDDCTLALVAWTLGQWDSHDRKEYYDITTFEWVSVLEIAEVIADKFNAVVIKGETKDTIQIGIENPPSDYILETGWKHYIEIEEGIGLLCQN